MRLRCPNCQGMLQEVTTLSQCPNCGADLSKLLTPLETGIMTDLGLTLLAGATGLLFGIAVIAHVKELRSPLSIVILILGSSLAAWGRAKSLKASERFYWERFWIAAFCGSIGAFWTVLMGLSWGWSVVLSLVGSVIGYWLCCYSQKQWQKERKI
ncbi:MAG: hypothetical protein N3B10_05730 [Armatimonadetes bacterium]|nr:hypothetical protein [Armatimonadota bacterium]MCX7967977.1 hypothetical protein [Armatimonadota bacterium]MDW8142409.1 hypothetical protein [Armatimonadota bacterium]